MSFGNGSIQYRIVSTEQSTSMLERYVDLVFDIGRGHQHNSPYLKGLNTEHLSEFWRLPVQPILSQIGGYTVVTFKRALVQDYCFDLVLGCFSNLVEACYEGDDKQTLLDAVRRRESYSAPPRFSANRESRDDSELSLVFDFVRGVFGRCLAHVCTTLELTKPRILRTEMFNNIRQKKLFYFEVEQDDGYIVRINVAFDNRTLTESFIKKNLVNFREKFSRSSEDTCSGSAVDMLVRNEVMPAALKLVIHDASLDKNREAELSHLDSCLKSWKFDSYQYVSTKEQ
ncbi:hypothetical protein KW429_11515 [Vibrio fluvialis]|nr:hypothetical protein [Vibrio fluvialis]MBY7902330.1 hypothetical protein [Vibrio fluvialis]